MRKNIKFAAFLAIVSSVSLHEGNAKTLMCPDLNDIHQVGHDSRGYAYQATHSQGDIKLKYSGNSRSNLDPKTAFSGLDTAPEISGISITCSYRGHIGVPGITLAGIYRKAEKKCKLSDSCNPANPTITDCHFNCE